VGTCTCARTHTRARARTHTHTSTHPPKELRQVLTLKQPTGTYATEEQTT